MDRPIGKPKCADNSHPDCTDVNCVRWYYDHPDCTPEITEITNKWKRACGVAD